MSTTGCLPKLIGAANLAARSSAAVSRNQQSLSTQWPLSAAHKPSERQPNPGFDPFPLPVLTRRARV